MADPSDEIQRTARQQALYQNAMDALLGSAYGTRITDAESGERKDTGVNVFAEEIARFLSTGEITLNDTLVIRTKANGVPAIKIIAETGPDVAPGLAAPQGPTGGIEYVNGVTGEYAQFGFGLQNIGILANEFMPNPLFFVNPEVAFNEFRTTGDPSGPTGATGYNPPRKGDAGQEGQMTDKGLGGIVGPGTGYDSEIYDGGTTSPAGGFNLGPLGFAMWYQYYGRPRPTGGQVAIDGYDGTVDVVTDVTWNETTCEMTKEVSTLTFKNGILTGVS